MTTPNPPYSPAHSKPNASTIDELPAIKQLLIQLDKTFKTARTYGPNNPVAQKFFLQFYTDLMAQLEQHETLLFLVQRSELYYRGEVVYQASSPTENLAFKLHMDGIRELSLHKGLSQSDLAYFLEALWGTYDADTSDDDIVTRLWEKNLSTISFVTAEEIIKSSDGDVLKPQNLETLNSPLSNLRQMSSTETARHTKEGGGGAGAAGSQVQPVPVGYEMTPEELEKLAQEIGAESTRDNTTYLLDMLTAILASEQSDALLSRLLELFAEILELLTKQGNWKLLNTIVSLLHESQDLCPNLSDEHRKKLTGLFDSLGRPERIKTMETALNEIPDGSMDDLHALLLMLKENAVPSLCSLMANLKHKSHRLVVCEVLTTLGKQNPTQLLKGLGDSRWYYVRNLVSVIGKLANPQLAKSLAPLVRHTDVRVRKEVIRTLRALCPKGRGDQFIAFLNDHEESIRLTALKVLSSGQYTASFELWAQVITPPAFQDRSMSEKRAVFLAMCQMSGEAVVPFCRNLVTQWVWTHRTRHQEAAVLAAEVLGRVGTPEAIAALEAGKKRLNRTIRQACAHALGARSKPLQENPA